MQITKFSPCLKLYLTDFIFTAPSEAVTLIPTLHLRKLRHNELHGLPQIIQIRDKEQSTTDRAQAPQCTFQTGVGPPAFCSK